MIDRRMIWVRALAIGAIVFTLALPGMATAAPPADIKSIQTRLSFDDLVARLESAIAANKMGLVAQASASAGAASRGVKIPGNAVLMVFRNDFAVRMLAASVPAGIEAPIRYYVTENADGTATLSYRPPSVVFAPYGSAKLDELARELDAIFDKIGRDATGG